MTNSRIRMTTRWVLPALFLTFPAVCLSQADIVVGGSEADDGAYVEPYSDQYDAYGEDYSGGMDDGLPIVYAGDGMRVSIEQVDESGSYAAGTVTIGKEAPMRFEVEMQLGQNGTMSVGQIQTASGPRPFRAWDQNEEVTIAEFEGRRYRLVYQDSYPADPAGPSFGNEAVVPGNSTAVANNPAREVQTPEPSPGPRINNTGSGTIELVMHKVGGTHTLLAPRGWKVEGGAWEPPVQAFSWMPSRHITVTASDGTSVRFKPNFSAIYQQLTAVQPAQPGSLNESAGLLNMPMPGNSSEWAQWIERDSIRTFYTDASDIRVSARVEPALTEKLRRLYAQYSQFMGSMQASDYGMRAEQNAMSARSSYRAGGKRWQQVDAFNQLVTMGQVASAFGGADYYVGWDLRDVVSLRAPEGTLDSQMPVLLAIVNSLRQTPEYSRQLLELQTRISQGNHDAAMRAIETYRQISQNSYNAQQEINAGMMSSFDQRNASQDRGQADFVNYIHDQQDYVDPTANGNVTLPASYERVFSNGRGEYVLTNDASFEPGADWSAIQRRR